MPTTLTSKYVQASLECYKWPEKVVREDYQVAANTVIPQGGIVAVITAANANDVQTLANTGTGGTFTLTFGTYNPQTTAPLTVVGLTAAAVQTALQNLANVGAGNVTVTGGPFTSGAGSLTITWSGAMADQPQPLVTVNSSVTGGAVTATHTTTGVANGSIVNYVNGGSNGAGVPIGAAWYAMASDGQGRITFGSSSPSGNEFQPSFYAGNVAVAGYFLTTNLSVGGAAGIDSTTASDLGRLLSGTNANGVFAMFGA